MVSLDVPPRAEPEAVKKTIASRNNLMLACRFFLCSGVSLVSFRASGTGLNWSRGIGNLLMSNDLSGMATKTCYSRTRRRYRRKERRITNRLLISSRAGHRIAIPFKPRSNQVGQEAWSRVRARKCQCQPPQSYRARNTSHGRTPAKLARGAGCFG